MRKTKQETNKLKGKIYFKCFNYGKVGHFSSKFPYAKGSESDEEEETPMKQKKHHKGNIGKFLKKNLYLKEDSSSSNEDDSDNDSRRVLFMELEEIIENNKDNCEQGVVNIEEELISSLRDLKKDRKKNKQLKEELSKMKESIQKSINLEQKKKVFIELKVKLEESKAIEETLGKQLEEKKGIQVDLEDKIVSLRGKLQSKDIKQNFDNITKILYQIIRIQRLVYDKSILG